MMWCALYIKLQFLHQTGQHLFLTKNIYYWCWRKDR